MKVLFVHPNNHSENQTLQGLLKEGWDVVSVTGDGQGCFCVVLRYNT